MSSTNNHLRGRRHLAALDRVERGERSVYIHGFKGSEVDMDQLKSLFEQFGEVRRISSNMQKVTPGYGAGPWGSPRGGWTRARERVLHTFSSLSPVAKVHVFQFCLYYSQIDNVLMLNSGGSVVQLHI